jgi:GMP synthase PP-ATPase subunit
VPPLVPAGLSPSLPGLSLAIRIRGEVTAERLQILRKADQIFLEEIREGAGHESCKINRLVTGANWASVSPVPARSWRRAP